MEKLFKIHFINSQKFTITNNKNYNAITMENSQQQEIQHTLLLVDDEESILSSLNRLLRRKYKILSTTDGAEGLNILQQNANNIDVVIVDQRMPKMSGIDFLKQVKENNPQIVRLVLSAYLDLETLSDAVNQGFIYKFIVKPWDEKILLDSIAEACEYKKLCDKNRQLTKELQQKNKLLSEANNLLQKGLDDNNHKLLINSKMIGLFHEILELLPFPILGIDAGNMIAATNQAAESLFSQSNSLLLGNNALLVLPQAISQQLVNISSKFNCSDSNVSTDFEWNNYKVLVRQLGICGKNEVLQNANEVQGKLLVFIEK